MLSSLSPQMLFFPWSSVWFLLGGSFVLKHCGASSGHDPKTKTTPAHLDMWGKYALSFYSLDSSPSLCENPLWHWKGFQSSLWSGIISKASLKPCSQFSVSGPRCQSMRAWGTISLSWYCNLLGVPWACLGSKPPPTSKDPMFIASLIPKQFKISRMLVCGYKSRHFYLHCYTATLEELPERP